MLEHQRIKAIHYLDDFLLFGTPESQECKLGLESMQRLCVKLGIPNAHHKMEGGTCRLMFLGMELDSETGTLHLPVEKLQQLRREITQWMGRSSCTQKKKPFALVGQLQHACCMVRPGRTSLRNMINLAKVANQLHHNIRLNKGFQLDLQWWSYFLPSWNGISVLAVLMMQKSHQMLSGSWGCGAFHQQGSGSSCNGQHPVEGYT